MMRTQKLSADDAISCFFVEAESKPSFDPDI